MQPFKCALQDGRTLAGRIYGATAGFPIVFFHGNLNSSAFAPVWTATDEKTAAAGARVIAVDRPGYGGSSFVAGRSYASWPADVLELADELKLERFAVLGYSSGGPNAMACAADACGGLPGPQQLSPSRLAACGLISPDGPYRAMGDPELFTKMFGSAPGPAAADLYGLQDALEARARATADSLRASYESMGKPDRRAIALADIDAATAQGIQAAAQDGVLESGDWGFELGSIRGDMVPTLLWHGVADDDVPIAAGRWVADAIPGCSPTFIEGESHSLIRRHWQSILESVVAAATASKAGPGKL